jgi:hypothetical protein
MVEKQMRNWELAKTQRLSRPEPRRPEVEDFVSISRSVAAGGKDVALKLGDALGWPVFDRGILQVMAGDNDIRREIYASMDERDLGWCEESLRSLMQPEFVKNDYFHRLTETVLSIARQGHAVFLGRGTDLILPRHIGFRVRLVAPHDVCIKNFADRHVISLKHAREDIARIEKERAEFIRHHFRTTPDDPLRYDLIISTAMFSPDQAVDLILDARKRAGIGQ